MTSNTRSPPMRSGSDGVEKPPWTRSVNSGGITSSELQRKRLLPLANRQWRRRSVLRYSQTRSLSQSISRIASEPGELGVEPRSRNSRFPLGKRNP